MKMAKLILTPWEKICVRDSLHFNRKEIANIISLAELVEENKKRREIYEENKKVAMNQAFQEELEDRDIILKTQEGK